MRNLYWTLSLVFHHCIKSVLSYNWTLFILIYTAVFNIVLCNLGIVFILCNTIKLCFMFVSICFVFIIVLGLILRI